jgi:23S rRNA G2445 N2-methylase RlmL
LKDTKGMSDEERRERATKPSLPRGVSIFVKAPPGADELVRAEVARVIADPWLPRPKESPRLVDDAKSGGRIPVDGLTFAGVHELLCRLRTAEDVELVLVRGRATDFGAFEALLAKAGFSKSLPARARVRVTADARGGRLWHEGALRERLAARLCTEGFVAGPEAEAGEAPRVEAPMQEKTQDRIQEPARPLIVGARVEGPHVVVTVSLSGRTLGARGYKAVLAANAPLREEQAACALGFLGEVVGELAGAPWAVWVPFAGTGTFGFEAALTRADANVLQATRTLPSAEFAWWSESTWKFLGRRQSAALAHLPPVAFLERDEETCAHLQANLAAFEALVARTAGASQDAARAVATWRVEKGDYFDSLPPDEILGIAGAHPPAWLVLPLNPPYGVRLARGARRYERIAARAREIRSLLGARVSGVAGVLLCASEEDWSDALRALGPKAHAGTRHFTQGGLDVRCLAFRLD